ILCTTHHHPHCHRLLLSPYTTLFRSFVAELDDLDRLHVLAHRVQVRDRVEVTIERAFAVGVGADVIVLRPRIAADHLGACGGGRSEEQTSELQSPDKLDCRLMLDDNM